MFTKLCAYTLAIAFILLGAFSLAGCSAISAGTITSKDRTDGYYYTTRLCTAYSKNGTCTSYIPMQNYVSPTWKFNLSDEKNTGWVYVTEDTYNSYEVGDYFKES